MVERIILDQINDNSRYAVKFEDKTTFTKRISSYCFLYKLEDSEQFNVIENEDDTGGASFVIEIHNKKMHCFKLNLATNSETYTEQKLKGTFSIIYNLEDDESTVHLLNFCNMKGIKSFSCTSIETNNQKYRHAMINMYTHFFKKNLVEQTEESAEIEDKK